MISERPKVLSNGLYTQAQAARALGVSRHTVARYAQKGLLKFRIRRAGMTAVTTGEEILKLWNSRY